MDFIDPYFDRNVFFFHELIRCAHSLWAWIYDSHLQMVYSNYPNADALGNIFALDPDNMWILDTDYDKSRPAVLTNSLGLMWVVDFVYGERGEYIHAIGPVFYGDVSPRSIQQSLESLNLSIGVKQAFLKEIENLPVVTSVRMLEYGIMLHYTLTGERITVSDFQYRGKTPSRMRETLTDLNRHGTWAVEQTLLKFIEEGNLNYKQERDKLVLMGSVGKMSDGNPIRQVKNQIIIYTALCTRAAIRGGLSPEMAYTISDQYIISAEACKTLSELIEVNQRMQDDFIHRVHNVKLQTTSQQVRACCNYIQLHITEKITVAALAAHVGYAENYLCRKFLREMGLHITDYVNKQKVEYAKDLLITGEQSVQEVADQLGFGTQSYFGEQFKKYTGITPGAFRNRVMTEPHE